MLYQHAHTLLEVDGFRTTDITGTAFRIRPADHDASDAQQSFVLWSTLTTRGEVSGESRIAAAEPEADKPDKPEPEGHAQLLFEVSADGNLWVPLDPHLPRQPARVVRVPFMLPFVRARVMTRGLKYEARAILLGSSPFSLHAQIRRDVVIVVGRS
jgi:hypothetical protein